MRCPILIEANLAGKLQRRANPGRARPADLYPGRFDLLVVELDLAFLPVERESTGLGSGLDDDGGVEYLGLRNRPSR